MKRNNPVNRAIGVFDSGLGGLTVVKELMRQLPRERIVYFGDTARVPYGTKSKESIIRFSKENVSLLLRHNVKMVVVACNTSSSVALNILRRKFPLPIIGVIHPGAKKASQVTRNKKIGVIATMATVESQAYTKNIHAFDRSIKVFGKACPLFVPLAEEGWFGKKITLEIAREYLAGVKRFGADTLILGCTHYPLLKQVVQRAVGRKVKLVDSAKEVAFEVRELLRVTGTERAQKKRPRHIFLVSDEPGHFLRQARRFLGYNIGNVRKSDPCSSLK